MLLPLLLLLLLAAVQVREALFGLPPDPLKLPVPSELLQEVRVRPCAHALVSSANPTCQPSLARAPRGAGSARVLTAMARCAAWEVEAAAECAPLGVS